MKIDLLILTALFGAYQLKIEPHGVYFAFGVLLMVFVVLLQFFYLVPIYEDGEYRTIRLRPPFLDFIIGCHIIVIYVILIGYSEYPQSEEQTVQAANMMLSVLTILLGVGGLRAWNIFEVDRGLTKEVVKQYFGYMVLLIFYISAAVVFSVGM